MQDATFFSMTVKYRLSDFLRKLYKNKEKNYYERIEN